MPGDERIDARSEIRSLHKVPGDGRGRAVVTRGVLGWGNRKAGTEAYGPGGRWEGGEHGHLLGDHLAELGVHEGAHLIIVAVPSRFDRALADRLAEAIQSTVDDTVEEVHRRCR